MLAGIIAVVGFLGTVLIAIPMYIFGLFFEMMGFNGKKKTTKPQKTQQKKTPVSAGELGNVTNKKELREAVRLMGFDEAIKRKKEILQIEKQIKETGGKNDVLPNRWSETLNRLLGKETIQNDFNNTL